MVEKYKGLSWDELGFSEKAKLFNKWSLVSIIANLFLIAGTILYIVNRFKRILMSETLLGFGCMLTWISFSRYIENATEYSFVNRTMKAALPIVMRTMIGILPFFIGFAFLGLCLFWESSRFSCTSNALFTLFAMMNGDAISDV